MSDGELIPTDGITTLEDKAYRAYQMRMAGSSWIDIAHKIGYKSGVEAQTNTERLIEKARRVVDEDLRRDVLNLELDRLDALQEATWGMALSGDLKAVEASLKIMTHRAKLLALAEERTGQQHTLIVTSDSYVESLKELTEQ